MFRTILVPLDGSSASEHALPMAVSLARRAGCPLRLVCVRQPMAGLEGAVPLPKEQDYLDMMAWRIRQATHLSVYSAVLEGPVAETIAEHAASVHANLIVMTTHGRGPFSRFWLGSVADDLIRRMSAALLVVRPGEGEPPPPERDWRPGSILVALDGSRLAEASLRPVTEIARLTDAKLTLFRAIEPIPMLAPDGLIPQPTILDAAVLDDIKNQARSYLENQAERLRKERLCVTCSVAMADRIAPIILDESKRFDLTALATHARHGVARMLLGSVADKVVRGATGPVLIVHPEAH
jgi:nucleotide-binding universal stress UspA family protein